MIVCLNLLGIRRSGGAVVRMKVFGADVICGPQENARGRISPAANIALTLRVSLFLFILTATPVLCRRRTSRQSCAHVQYLASWPSMRDCWRRATQPSMSTFSFFLLCILISNLVAAVSNRGSCDRARGSRESTCTASARVSSFVGVSVAAKKQEPPFDDMQTRRAKRPVCSEEAPTVFEISKHSTGDPAQWRGGICLALLSSSLLR
jgi:hypothetical protein